MKIRLLSVFAAAFLSCCYAGASANYAQISILGLEKHEGGGYIVEFIELQTVTDKFAAAAKAFEGALPPKVVYDGKGSCSIAIDGKEYRGKVQSFLLPEDRWTEVKITGGPGQSITFSGRVKPQDNQEYSLQYDYVSNDKNHINGLNSNTALKCGSKIVIAGTSSETISKDPLKPLPEQRPIDPIKAK